MSNPCAQPLAGDLLERLEAHMAHADLREVLSDAHEAAAEIRRLSAELENAFGDELEVFKRAERLSAELEECRKALERQGDNMAFILNRVELPEAWFAKFDAELAEDRALLQPKEPSSHG